ncbi:MAG: hypothetical protein CL480_03080 [Acidobacteria bacterium]|nr:hypothetical protein [Acidobacteriota bacterium]
MGFSFADEVTGEIAFQRSEVYANLGVQLNLPSATGIKVNRNRHRTLLDPWRDHGSFLYLIYFQSFM